ncbi:MAG: divalent heavy-metal cations transporter [Candidatus Planktophila sp.]|nr:divalent heavy-metal cations transporter [Candidatus Planktophila sp.]
MSIAIALAAVTAIATTGGGYLAIRSRDRLHLVLGLSAGLLLGLVGFDLLPEVFELNTSTFGNVRVVSIAFVLGFLLLHIAEQIFGSHEPAESDFGHAHDHSVNIAGTLGAVAMGGHVFLDGVAMGLAFKVSNALGFAVFIAIVSHAFSDGLNTVSLLIKSGHWSKSVSALLGLDAIMRISGAALGTYILISDPVVGIYLATFSGFLIYLATSHILPEAHSRHPSRLTLLATVIGVFTMWLIVANI